MKRLVLTALMGGVLLAGCTQTNVRPDIAPAQALWEQRQVALAGIKDWDVTGRIGIVTAKEGWHASLHWKQQADAYEIHLSGPLGQGVVQIYGDDSGVSLVVPKEAIIQAESPQALLQENLGWSLPVNALRYWARGLSVPNMPAQETLDDQGRLTELHQDNWHILYSRYVAMDGVFLPAKIVLEQADMKAKIIFSNWTLESAAR